MDSHIEPGNSWAKIYADYAGGTWHTCYDFEDELVFYFPWRNTFGRDVIVNVSSSLMLNGFGYAEADWGPHQTDLDVLTGLNLLELWNDPPTEPGFQDNQIEFITQLEVGGLGLFGEDYTYELINRPSYVNYKRFLIPPDGLAVFEVAFLLDYLLCGGRVVADFNRTWPPTGDDYKILCPYVDLEIL